MKSVKVLLFAVFTVMVLSGILASKARLNNRIYMPHKANPLGPCDSLVFARTFVSYINGDVIATTMQFANCEVGFTYEILN